MTFHNLITRSRNAETAAVGNRMCTVFKASDWTSETHLSMIFEALTVLVGRLITAVNHAKKESQLENLDEVRDNKVRAVHYLLLASMQNPAASVNQAAKAVNGVFNRYGLTIINENYSTESTLIDSLLEDFAATDLQASIAAVPQLTDLIAGLQTAENTFEDARVAYEVDKTYEGTQENATQLKAETITLINEQILVYLRAMVQVDEPTYGELARTITTIIDENNQMVRMRKKKELEA